MLSPSVRRRGPGGGWEAMRRIMRMSCGTGISRRRWLDGLALMPLLMSSRAAMNTDAFSERVYAKLLADADTVVRSGFAAVADAVFAKPVDREAIQHVAAAAGVPFTGVWLEAPESVLRRRVAGRQGDVSDADAAVMQRPRTYPLGVLRWHHLRCIRDAATGL